LNCRIAVVQTTCNEVGLMVYVVCSTLLFIGALGLLVSLLMGGHHGAHHGGTHHTAGHATTHAANHSHVQDHAHSDNGGHNDHGIRLSSLLNLLSPIGLFSICLGAGATGLLVKHLNLISPLVALCAATGGIVFFGLMVRPLMSLVLNFASTPSKALDGVISEPAEVLSRFDSSGKGLVKLTVDGQFVRVLATLEDSDRASASEINPGDRLVVTSIDGHSNACKVARI
jgi:hypothetical protein